MSGDEFQLFEAELQKLKPSRPPQDFVSRLAVAAFSQKRQRTGPLGRVLSLLYRSLSACERVAYPRSADYNAPLKQTNKLRYAALLRWLVPGSAVVAVAMVLWLRQTAKPGQTTHHPATPPANSELKADNVEIDRQLLASFDAVARLPGGEPVRFRCRKWVDQVVFRDSKRGIVIEQRAPHLEVVPVGFETE